MSKTYLLEVLGGRSRNFIVKANFLKIYYFLYIQSEATIDDT